MRAWLLALAALSLAGCSDGGDGGDAPSSYETHRVTIDNGQFLPSSLAVRQGDRVEWTNEDASTHAVRLDSGERQTGAIRSGETVGFQLPTPGSLVYRCTFHPSMSGTIIVAAD